MTEDASKINRRSTSSALSSKPLPASGLSSSQTSASRH